MKFEHIVIAVTASLLFPACKKEEAPPPPVSEAPAPAAPVAYQPPANGLLDPVQAKQFAEAQKALGDLNARYLDSLNQATDASAAKSIEALMEAAKDVAARKFGLNGYDEYRWILEEAPKVPENRAVFAEVGIIIPL